MLLHTGTEEIGHIEVLATAVAMNLEGAPEEMIDDVVTNPVVAARMGGLEPRHILSSGLAATPADANGVPFNAACLDIGGNLLANLHANVAAEAIGRTLAARLRDLTDDPGMKDMLSYLIARDTMHQQQWLAAIDELNPAQRAVPVEVADEGDYDRFSHAFLTHADVPVPEDATWAKGSARDGAAFSLMSPEVPAGQEPQLQRVAPYVHAGPEATSNGSETGVFGKVKRALTS